MKFNVLSANIENLVKKLQRMHLKHSEFSYTVSKEPKFIESKQIKGMFYECFEVEVLGEYKYNDWEFVGSIEHTKLGNIIRKISDVEVPSKFLTCESFCDHCKVHRFRKETYLIRNISTNEFKQVGKKCLQEYTGGLLDKVCREFALILKECESFSEEYIDDLEVVDPIHFSSSNMCMPKQSVQKVAYAVIKVTGYSKEYSRELLSDLIYGGLSNEEEQEDIKAVKKFLPSVTEETIEEITDFSKTIDLTRDSYERNASLTWNKDYLSYKDFCLVLSFISYFLKNKEMKNKFRTEADKSTFVGTVGEKITFKVVSLRVLYTKSYVYGYDSYSCSYVYKLTDEEGHTIIWSTSKSVNEGDVITAKVKEHSTYRNFKQTTITGGKINA